MAYGVRFVGEVDGSLWGWMVRSRTDLRVWYDVHIDLGSGECLCTCMDFQCRRRKLRPDLFGGCKHVRLVRLEAKRLDEERRK